MSRLLFEEQPRHWLQLNPDGIFSMTFSTEKHAGVCEQPDAASKGFVLNHAMMRVKDPVVSLDFYTRIMGMRLLRKLDFPEMQFSLFFLAVAELAQGAPDNQGERTAWIFSQSGILELTHNWGTESQADFKYHDGNAQPQGFGHICFSVPDLASAVSWFDENQVAYVKRPDQGKMKDVAFIKDPDGYWIEIVQPSLHKQLGASA
jgi:lactoylglutathione lyase